MDTSLRLKSAFAIFTVLVLAQPAQAAEECRRSGGSFRLTSPGPWIMTSVARSGQECRGYFRSSGTTIFKNLYLVSAPSNGTVRLQSGGYYFYKAKAGFRGNDAFTLRICGTQGGFDGCTDLALKIIVE
jgi:hypothetical protein